jgi:anion-transporting  ArsA/GET3 family ATPase
VNLYDRQLLVVAGKGGVGRTTVAAAMALAAAREGRRVLLAQARSKERLSRLLGGPPVLHEIVAVRPNLWAVNITPEAALREYGLMVLRSGIVYRAVFENRLSRAFIRAIPGVEDYSVLGKIWYHTTEVELGRPKYDLIVFDAPATGHVVNLLQIPQAILDAVPEGPLTRDARSARALLTDARRSSMVLVTLAEEMPVNEAIELAARTGDRVGIHLGLVVVNQLFPARFAEGPAGEVIARLPEPSGDSLLDAVAERARLAIRRRAMNDRYRERLLATLGPRQVDLPFLFAPEFGVREVESLAARLATEHLPPG